MADNELELSFAKSGYDEAVRQRDKARAALADWEGIVVRERTRWEDEKRMAAASIPVDRTAVQLTDGSPVPSDRSHTEKTSSGQQKGYIVLSPEERAKGFVRPVRRSYTHLTCGSMTTMGQSLAETYARDPFFYGGTFCCQCRDHFPVGEDGEFVWFGTDEKVGI